MTPSSPQSEGTTGENSPVEAPDSRPNSASRRRFLQSGGVLGSALVLGLLKDAEAQGEQAADAGAPQLVLKLVDNAELGKPNGWKIFDFGTDRVIVVNTETGFIARSAVCTHKGCDVNYVADAKQFVCPCHRAAYDLDGKVLRGPAKAPLAAYDAQNALIVATKK